MSAVVLYSIVSMSRLPTSRFPPPVLFPSPAVPSKSAASFHPSASAPVLYDSDSYDEDGGSFQLLPSPEHYLNSSGDSPGPTTRLSSTRPVLYDEEEELVSPSSSYTTMSPSSSLEQLPPPVTAQSERKSSVVKDAAETARVPSSRNNRMQHRNALRLDLMDADEDESVNEDDDEAEKRRLDASQTAAPQLNGLAQKRPSTIRATPPLQPSIKSAPSTSSFSSVAATALLNHMAASTSPIPVPARSTPTSPALSSSISDVSLPAASYDEYNDSGHSLNDSPGPRFRGLRRSTRHEYDEEDDGGYDNSADVIELEDEDRDRESSGSAGKVKQRGGRAQSATHAVAAPPTQHRSTPSPQPVPLLSSPSPPLHPSSSSSSISPFPTASPALVTSASVPVLSQLSSGPHRGVVPMSVRTSSVEPVDDEGEDGDDEHDDQHNEETDETSSAVISLPAGTQDKHNAVRTFNSANSSLLRTLTSSYSSQVPLLQHSASNSSTASMMSSSSSTSHVSTVAELPTSPPASGTEDADGDEFNDGDVMVVMSPHHSHSPSRAHQQPGQATDEEDDGEGEPIFRLREEQEEESEPQPQARTSVLLPAALTPSKPSRRPSHVSIAGDDDDEFAEAKLRREKLIAGKAARLAKKSKHERWEKDSSVRRDSKRRSAARQVSKRSGERTADSDSSASSDSSTSSASQTPERSDDERREVEDNSERARDVSSASSNRRSPAPHTSAVSPPSPAHPPIPRPSSRSSSPMKPAYRHQHQHDEAYQTQHQHPSQQQHDEAGAAHTHAPIKQREERWPSDNNRESSPLPPSHPLILSRTGSHSSSRSLKKKKRGSSEDEIRVADLDFKEKIGEGAYGDVYRGYLWGQEIAIKQIRQDGGKDEADEGTVREFRREMKIMKHLRHPNVVEFLGACISEQSLCLLTEYMPNGSLEDQLARLRREGRRMRESRVVSLSLDVVKGLNWLHHKGIIHRDIKSANILLDAAGRAKLADFGLSHVRRRREESMDGYHGVAGTPSYIAPEVLMGREYGVKADVYSLGVLINEMLATEAPYDDTPLVQLDLPAFEAAVIAGGRPKLADCQNGSLTQLVLECWHVDADSRPTVESIMKSLERTDRDMQVEQQQQLIAHAAEAASPSSSSALDDLPTPLRSLIANDYARLYQMKAALAEQERLLQARSAAMASEKAAREEEHKQWEEIRDRHKREDADERKKRAGH